MQISSNRAAELLVRYLDETNRSPDLIVGPPDDPYMLRWHYMRTPIGGKYFHEFRRDDDDRALHDHPWPSVSVLLGGIIREIYAPPGTNPSDKSQHAVRLIRPGDVIYRSSKFAHRVELVTSRAFTVFYVGPRLRDWGFWCPNGWVEESDYVAAADRGQIGAGCG